MDLIIGPMQSQSEMTINVPIGSPTVTIHGTLIRVEHYARVVFHTKGGCTSAVRLKGPPIIVDPPMIQQSNSPAGVLPPMNTKQPDAPPPSYTELPTSIVPSSTAGTGNMYPPSNHLQMPQPSASEYSQTSTSINDRYKPIYQ
jgi:hypothetical protein